jgi:DNA replication protein DnaC
MRSEQAYDLPPEWKSARWWEHRTADERLFHMGIPPRVEPFVDKAITQLMPFHQIETPELGDNIVITGPGASGKSALACAIAERMVKEKGASARYVRASAYREMLLDSFDGGLKAPPYPSTHLLKWLKGVFDVVVIDDLGAEYTKEVGEGFTNQELTNLIRTRFDNMQTTILVCDSEKVKSITDLGRFYGQRLVAFNQDVVANNNVITLGRARGR